MPPLPAAAKVIRTALSGTISVGDVWLTRFYIGYTGTAPTNAQLLTYDAAIATAYSADLKALVDTDSVLTQIESVDLTSATGAVDVTAESIAGTRTGVQLPSQVAAVVSYGIGRRYRGGHPRGYWRFGTSTDLGNPSNWTGAFITAANSGIAAFYTAVLAAGWTGAGTLSHINVSYYSGFTVVVNPTTGRARNVPTLRTTPIQDPVTSALTRTSIGTQRRREAFID